MLVPGDADLDGKTSVGETVGSELANELGLVDSPAPIIGEFILDRGHQPLVARQSEQVIHPIGLAPRHQRFACKARVGAQHVTLGLAGGVAGAGFTAAARERVHDLVADLLHAPL